MNVSAFLSTLPTMLYGMLGIFGVMAIIWAVVALLNKFTK